MKYILLSASLALLVGATVVLAGDAVAPVAPRASTSVSFAKAITLRSPVLYPSSLAAGDLNHDGFPDLAVVSDENTAPLVHALGKGNGRFRSWRNDDRVGYSPGFVLLADVDGDGNLDAITTDIESGELFVAFGDGKGHLDGGKQLLVSGVNSTYIVAVADLNGDGIPDIVGTTNFGIFVILGKGSRKFANAVTFSSGGQQPYGIVVGDLNHDGIPDLIVANNGRFSGPYGSVTVLLGRGDGTFTNPRHYLQGARPSELVLGDLNGDGNLDVAVVGGTEHVDVLLGNGDGTFSRPKSYQAGISPHAIAAADVNGDGKLDLVVLAANVTILLGNGDGTFQPPVRFHAYGHPNDFVVADFNHDGKPDIATIETVHSSSFISILLNTTQFPAPAPH